MAQTVPVHAGTVSDGVLWDATVRPLLTQDLWSDSSAYNAAHFLMVPLHAAFSVRDAARQTEFAAHFTRFLSNGFDSPGSRTNRLVRLQYLYFASRFVVLAAESGRTDLIPTGLVDRLYNLLEWVWARDTAFGWDRAFPGGVRERLEWKLTARNPARGYYRAIVDAERFLFGIAADLRHYERATGRMQSRSTVVLEVLSAALRSFEQRGVPQPDGGWLFQPGVSTDYPDYAYAGQPAIIAGMARALVPGIAEDASHSFRMALLLTSLIGAYAHGEATRAYYQDIRRRLARQLLGHVLVPPSADFPGYRITNFMDGRNGVYRWGYRNRGPEWGYGPYEVSGSFLMGWWSFLADSAVTAVYRGIAESFPLSAPVLSLYARGAPHPDSHDPRHIIRDSWANGLRLLVVRLAARFPS
jgi:hypothetical protein